MRTFLLSVVAIVAIATPTVAILWYPIDINDPYVQEIGKRAVTEHVKQTNDTITFNRVLSGEKQERIGLYSRLIIGASSNDGREGKYEAVAHQTDWGEKQSLLSFKPAN
ncbi:hypothetical protein PAHAL_2G421800 [Panicum hallii]|jgi:hypothetical protein|uniref:Cystatin domain-containing protein n=1 Tax=Panicum hallii TaxID=206008 RepID=A0A2S3H3E0_9POAL|nr:hypothetical protein PAHAL_2G421800 [Panicum hallii]